MRSTTPICAGIVASLALVVALAASSVFAAERYLAVLRSGETLESARPPVWHEVTSNSRFANAALLENSRDVLLLRDRHQTPRLTGAYLELANGDILPGVVTSYEPTDPKFGHQGVLYVAPEAPLDTMRGGRLAVRADRVLRIVATSQPLSTTVPNTVLLHDGRKVVGRSLRISSQGVAVLGDAGLITAGFSQLADVTFAAPRNQAVIEDSLLAGPLNDIRIVRLGTREGALLTGSRLYRYSQRERRRGASPITARTSVVLQPAWALEPISVSETSIVQSSFRKPDELPLSNFDAQALLERGTLGGTIPWRRNRGVHDTPLAGSTALEADFGVGVHAHSELAFDLPAEAQELSLWVGLDRAARNGGCVVCKVVRDSPTGEVLWQSEFLRGGEAPVSVGPLAVRGAKRVVLVTEMAHPNRPDGADPLDIRDDVVWLSPLVTFSAPALMAPSVLGGYLRGASGWHLDPTELAKTQLATLWNPQGSRWDPVIRIPATQELTFTKKVAVTPGADVLEFVTSATPRVEDHDFVLLVDGRTVPWATNRNRERAAEEASRFTLRGPTSERYREELRDDTMHYWWNLQPYRGREVTLTLSMLAPREVDITWRSLAIRGAVRGAPAAGKTPAPDVLLTSLEPVVAEALRDRAPPLVDRLPGRRGEPLSFLGQPYRDGFGLVRNSRLSFAIPANATQFVAIAGVCKEQAGPLRVLVDERVVWEAATADAAAGGQWLEIPLPAGAKSLTLETGPDGGYSGAAAFAHAGFMVKK